jgi:hypothetical protein
VEGIEVTAPLHFEIAVGNGTFDTILNIPQSGGDAQAAISVRVADTAPVGDLTGTIYLTSREAVTRRIGVYATVTPKLTLSTNLETLVEGDEFSEAQVTLRRSGPTTASLTANVSENRAELLEVDLLGDLNYAELPVEVTIPAGSDSVEFYIRAKENTMRAQTAILSASALGLASSSVNFTITDNDPGSSFDEWLNGSPPSAENLKNYAIGGAMLAGQPSQLPVLSMNATHMSLNALVRTDDPNLTYHGEWTTDLRNGTWTRVPLQAPASQTSFGNLLFSIPRQDGETKKFLRLRINLQE